MLFKVFQEATEPVRASAVVEGPALIKRSGQGHEQTEKKVKLFRQNVVTGKLRNNLRDGSAQRSRPFSLNTRQFPCSLFCSSQAHIVFSAVL